MIIVGYDRYVTEKKGLDEVGRYGDPVTNSVWNYVSGFTVGEINAGLRKGRTCPQLRAIVSRLDSAMSMRRVKVYRTVDWNYMDNIYGVTRDRIDDFVGREFVAKGYTSTTRVFGNVWGGGWSDRELCMEIESDGKVGCVDINSMFGPEDIDCEEQEEILLQRDLKFVIDGYDLMGGNGEIGGGRVVLMRLTVRC